MNEPAHRWEANDGRRRTLSGRLTLFGFPSTDAVVRVVPRSRSWRGIRAATFLGGGLLLAPVVGMVPPHAPWVAGVLGVGIFLGLRKWREHFTVASIQGRCPKCGETLQVRSGTPMRDTLSITCDACHHDSQLQVDLPADASSSGDSGAAPSGPAADSPESGSGAGP